MLQITELGCYPRHLPLLPDEMVEFHAVRLMLLMKSLGGRISGLTKLAKLDFFVRYPDFFSRYVGQVPDADESERESSMVRFHYGPWDHRYYAVLNYLEARDLVIIRKQGPRTFDFCLTEAGQDVAAELARNEAFADLVTRVAEVAAALGQKSGSALKQLVYELFDKEVTQLRQGEVIG